jgi:predicted dinucleotide-binding enzyme
MRIGIVGAGKVGGGLGKIWIRAGHHVLFSSRHSNRLKVLIEEINGSAQVREALLADDRGPETR